MAVAVIPATVIGVPEFAVGFDGIVAVCPFMIATDPPGARETNCPLERVMADPG
jgi:hypothetical protein